jgi:O-antigen/teichoic acid export membrane protein
MTGSLTDHLQQSARGSLILLIGQVSSTIITAIAIILVARFLGSTSYGQITIAMIPISLASMFTNPGVNSGLTKYIAQYRAEKKAGDIRTLLTTGLLINTAASVILLLVVNLSTGYLVEKVFHQPDIRMLIQVASLQLIAQALISTTRSIFVGFERMKYVSLMVIIQSILKSVLAPLLVIIGMGSLGAVLGNTASLIVTGAIGSILVITAFLKRPTKLESTISHAEAFRILLTYGFPLYLAVLIGGATTQVNNFLMAIHVDAFSIGNYQAAINFSVLINFFIMPISTVLFPLFSKIEPKENLILLSGPIVAIIYGTSYPLTAYFLQLFCINFLFIGIGAYCTGSLLNGQGMTKTIFIGSLLNLCTTLPLGFYLIPRYGIPGLIWTSIIAPKGALFYFLWQIKKNLGFTVKWKTSIKIYLSSAIPYCLEVACSSLCISSSF